MSKYCFGVDVGGTTVKLGLFTVDGTVLDKWEIVTRKEDGGKYILSDIASAIHEKLQEKNISKQECVGVGIGVPGPVDADGIVHKAANLGWGEFEVERTLSEMLELKVRAGNDANVAALGEMWKGGGKGRKNLVAVTLGTGVGGGIIVNGEILTGATGAGGEIGHIHIEDEETECCGCGNQGCLEQYSSATGLTRLAKNKLKVNSQETVLRSGELTAKAIFDAVKEGDAVAVEIVEQFAKYLGKALAIIASVVNPEIFVIGGGVSKAGNILIDYVKKYYEIYAFHGSKNAVFALAVLGNDAGIYGAAKLVIEE